MICFDKHYKASTSQTQQNNLDFATDNAIADGVACKNKRCYSVVTIFFEHPNNLKLKSSSLISQIYVLEDR